LFFPLGFLFPAWQHSMSLVLCSSSSTQPVRLFVLLLTWVSLAGLALAWSQFATQFLGDILASTLLEGGSPVHACSHLKQPTASQSP
jgi:hypothetical protein